MVENQAQYQIRLPDGTMSRPMSLQSARRIQKKLRSIQSQEQAQQMPQSRGIVQIKGGSYY